MTDFLTAEEREWLRKSISGFETPDEADNFDALKADHEALASEVERLIRDVAVVSRLLDRWIAAQDFDPNGGPTEDVDSCIVNAALVAEGTLEHNNEAVEYCLGEVTPNE